MLATKTEIQNDLCNTGLVKMHLLYLYIYILR